jgi:hypothetical protein
LAKAKQEISADVWLLKDWVIFALTDFQIVMSQ